MLIYFFQKIMINISQKELLNTSKNYNTNLVVTIVCLCSKTECNKEDFNEDVDKYELCIGKEARNYPIERDDLSFNEGDENGTRRRVDEQGDGDVDAGEGCTKGVGFEGMLGTNDLSIDDMRTIALDSVVDADAFYMMYSMYVGFSVRKGDRKIARRL
ncbi:hypothetical protein M9H77_35767 [Catharanthus roseus]|uniref:Uncharacterized protein n=1 Tax=Catharanthus roseus TaxID=4058 RepID=A0ACB9ZPX9_CATRO|nr:hypothetical protein M9H77_35767 [Catharanthus roseus]